MKSLYFLLLFQALDDSTVFAKLETQNNLEVVIQFRRNSVDTLYLVIEKPFHTYETKAPNHLYKAGRSFDGLFHFQMGVQEKFGTFRVYYVPDSPVDTGSFYTSQLSPVGSQIFWSQGDSLSICFSVVLDNNPLVVRPTFSGKGASKNELKFQMDSIRNQQVWIQSIHETEKLLKNSLEAQMKLLGLCNDLSREEHAHLSSYVVYSFCFIDYYFKTIVDKVVNAEENNVRIETLRKLFDRLNLLRSRYRVSDKTLAKDSWYLDYMLSDRYGQFQLNSLLRYGELKMDSIYFQIKRLRCQRPLRDALILRYFRCFFQPENFNAIYSDACETIVDRDLLIELKGLKTLQGFPVHDFLLSNTTGEVVKLSDFKGKVVLIDVWFTGCLPCQNYFKNVLSRAEEKYANNGDVVFLSISLDRDKNTWLNSIGSNKYTSAHATNLFTNGKGIDDPFMQYYGVVEAPTPILVDREGKLLSFRSEKLFAYDSLVKSLDAALKNEPSPF